MVRLKVNGGNSKCDGSEVKGTWSGDGGSG